MLEILLYFFLDGIEFLVLMGFLKITPVPYFGQLSRKRAN